MHTNRHREQAAALTAITGIFTDADPDDHSNHRYSQIDHHSMKIRPMLNIWSIDGGLMSGVIILKAPHGNWHRQKALESQIPNQDPIICLGICGV